MELLTRRTFLQKGGGTAASAALGAAAMATVGAGAAAATAGYAPADPQDLAAQAADTHAMLFDSTYCIGCRACEIACDEKNELGRSFDEIFEGRPTEDVRALDTNIYTYVTFSQIEADPSTAAFGKVQCMHCIEPACVSSCPVLALEKTPEGPVSWHPEICLGCRYCMMACPFLVPRFEWDSVNPRIRKCDMCYDRLLVNEPPACVRDCPTEALLWDTRDNIVLEAHQRLLDSPRTYVPHGYGEFEAGGTNFMHIAARPFDEMGYRRDLPLQSYRDLTRPVMHVIPYIMNAMALVLGGVAWIAHRGASDEPHAGAESAQQEGSRS